MLLRFDWSMVAFCSSKQRLNLVNLTMSILTSSGSRNLQLSCHRLTLLPLSLIEGDHFAKDEIREKVQDIDSRLEKIQQKQQVNIYSVCHENSQIPSLIERLRLIFVETVKTLVTSPRLRPEKACCRMRYTCTSSC